MAEQKPSPSQDTKPPVQAQPVLAASAQAQVAKPEQANPKANMEPRSISLSQGEEG